MESFPKEIPKFCISLDFPAFLGDNRSRENLSPMLGAAAVSGRSVCVVTNALRLRYFKKNKPENRQRFRRK